MLLKSKKINKQVEEAMDKAMALELAVGVDSPEYKEQINVLGKLVIKRDAIRAAKVAAITAAVGLVVYGSIAYLENKSQEGEEA